MEGCLKFLFEDHCYLISDVKKGAGSEITRFADDMKLFMGVREYWEISIASEDQKQNMTYNPLLTK